VRLRNFSIFQLIIIALMAAAGVATKPIVTALAHLVTGPLFIPGGAFAGGFYMLFIILGGGIVGKRGATTLIAFIQALLVLVTGIYGSHGAASLLTYTAPGLLVDLLWIIIRRYGDNLISCFLGGIVANLCGTFFVNLVFFRLPLIPLLLSLALAVFSGGIGGVIAHNIRKLLLKHKIITGADCV